MKKILITIFLLVTFLSSPSYAEWVNGYYKSNGTYVQGYNRSSGNNTVTDNYSYYGNTNPYTGSVGTNKYKNDSSSGYYNGGSIGNSGCSSSYSLIC